MKKYKFLALLVLGSVIGNSYPIVLNEYNGVAPDYMLKNDGYDSFYGRINGNGGKWIEMVVTDDKVDIRNATFKITGNGGTYFLGRFGDEEALSNLRSGTILTISEEPTDLSYDPFNNCNPDWTININKDDLETIEGVYDVNHNEIKISIRSEDDKHTIMKDSGEGAIGGGIDSREIFLLKTDPTEETLPTDIAYGDNGDKQPLSTFGSPNRWIDDNNNTQIQDLGSLRLEAKQNYFESQKSYLILNEYNSVTSDEYLKLNGTDSYFGQILGNGGSWLELLVIKDRLNLQNAIITIEENCQEIFSAKFPELNALGYLRKGTMLTISDEVTDMSYFPFAPYSEDWKLNLNIDDLYDRNGSFILSSNRTTITITNEDGTKFRLVKTGEGVNGDSVDNQEVYKLKSEPTVEISPYDLSYGDDNNGQAISTFGSPNSWRDGNGTLQTQKLSIRENEDLNETGGIALSNISDFDTMKDSESLLYVPIDNSLWIADDDSHQLFEMNYITRRVKSVFNDKDLGGFTNGDIQDHCGGGAGACDIEEVAYDSDNDILYVFTGKSPGTPAVYKLTRGGINEKFEVSDYRKLASDTEYPSAIYIDGDLIVSVGQELYTYDFETNTIGSTPLFSIEDDVGYFVGLAYSNGKLWITTIDKERLIKVDWSSKTVEHIYKMTHNGVYDPRGIEVIDNKLHILEGYDTNVPTQHVLKNAIHIYQIP